MSREYAVVWIPPWALRVPQVAEFAQRVTQAYEEGFLTLTGEFARDGCLPAALESVLVEHEVPYDFRVFESEVWKSDALGYWRPGLQESRTWALLEGEAFVWVADLRRLLDSVADPAECVAAVRVALDLADPRVPDLRVYPDPRARQAGELRALCAVGLPVRHRAKACP